jgi:hypothetical protein
MECWSTDLRIRVIFQYSNTPSSTSEIPRTFGIPKTTFLLMNVQKENKCHQINPA